MTKPDTCSTLAWSLLALHRPAYHHHKSCDFSHSKGNKQSLVYYTRSKALSFTRFQIPTTKHSVSQNTAILSLKCMFTPCCPFSLNITIKTEWKLQIVYSALSWKVVISSLALFPILLLSTAESVTFIDILHMEDKEYRSIYGGCQEDLPPPKKLLH